MTVFTQAFNLSDNVKYMNFKVDTTPSGGGNATARTTLDDRKELMHKIQEWISTEVDNQQIPINNTLGWQRIDGADSAGAILNNAEGVYNTGTGNAVYGFLRAKCYDYDTSGHWKYLRLKLFERNEDDVFGSDGVRYRSANSVLVLRYDVYSDWPNITAEDSAATVDSINGGFNSAEADGYGSTDLNAGTINGEMYGTANNPIGFDAAYNSNSTAFNNMEHPSNNYIYWKRYMFGNNGGLPRPVSRSAMNSTTSTLSANIGLWPGDGRKGYSLGHNFYPHYFGVTGFGDSDLSKTNSYGELKLIIDGNGTLWGFGDQDNVGATGVDSASGTGGHRGVNASGANARYLSLFVSQHQDDNPERQEEYNTILFAGEYKKEFGEPTASGSNYIHNGLKLNAHNLLMNNGVATPPNYKWFEQAGHTANNDTQNQTPSTTLTRSSLYYTFASTTNNVPNNLAINSTASYNTIANGNNYAGDNVNSIRSTVTNNTSIVEGIGHSLMGDQVGGNHSLNIGLYQNRSRSVGLDGDPAESRWKSEMSGNTARSTSSNNNWGGGTYAGQHGQNHTWLGNDGAQFALTEYPTRSFQGGWSAGNNITQKESIQQYDNYTTPASGRQALSATRLHMGYLGYVGHESSKKAISLNEIFFGSRHGMFGDDGEEVQGTLSAYYPGDPAIPGRVSTFGPSIPLVSDVYDSAEGNAQDTYSQSREYVQEFHPLANDQSQYSVYEPVLSVGTWRSHGQNEAENADWINVTNSNVVAAMATNTANVANNDGFDPDTGALGTPGGTSKSNSAFAMLGRTYGLKIFGPYTHDKYNFLDAVSIQLDNEDFYAVNPNNAVDHWVVPMNHDQCAFLFKK